MESYPSGALVRDRLMASLNNARTQNIFQAFFLEVENIRLRSSNVYKDALTQNLAVQDTVNHILEMPAGLAHSNFVDADIRKTFRRAVVCASKIRGMVLWSVVSDWKKFVSLLEELYGHLSKLDQEFKPDWVSAPGDTITDILEERGITVGEFAQQVNMSPIDANALLEGQTPITLEIALQLSQVLGSSVDFWLDRDAQYRGDEKEEE